MRLTLTLKNHIIIPISLIKMNKKEINIYIYIGTIYIYVYIYIYRLTFKLG